jgi:hypothetical protein
MKIAYLDLFSGVSGDMIVGAFIDAGVDIRDVRTALSSLLPGRVRVDAKKVERNGVTGTRFDVKAPSRDEPRPYKRIKELLEGGDLEPGVRDISLSVFGDIARAEGRVHGLDPEEVHFHEIGALDSVADIVGAAVCVERLGLNEVYASAVHVGRGTVDCRHGKLPVPAPATMGLLEGLPVYSTGISEEIVTPTGAAIIRNITRGFGDMPPMVVEKTAYGAGTKELELPNLLRVVIGESCRGGEGYDKSRQSVRSSAPDAG